MTLQSFIIDPKHNFAETGRLSAYARKGLTSLTETELGRIFKARGAKAARNAAIDALKAAVKTAQWSTVAYLSSYLSDTSPGVVHDAPETKIGGDGVSGDEEITFETVMEGVPPGELGSETRPNPCYNLHTPDISSPFLVEDGMIIEGNTVKVRIEVEGEYAESFGEPDTVVLYAPPGDTHFTKKSFARALSSKLATEYPKETCLLKLAHDRGVYTAHVVI